MTRKHFTAVADAIRDYQEELASQLAATGDPGYSEKIDAVYNTAAILSEVFAKLYPAFDRQRFIAAANPTAQWTPERGAAPSASWTPIPTGSGRMMLLKAAGHPYDESNVEARFE
jgi:hypothetical protein